MFLTVWSCTTTIWLLEFYIWVRLSRDVYSDVIQEAQSNNLLHMVRLSVRLDTPLHGNNARGAKYAVYYASVVTHTVFENIKWLCSALCRNRNVTVPSLACLFPDDMLQSHWLQRNEMDKTANDSSQSFVCTIYATSCM